MLVLVAGWLACGAQTSLREVGGSVEDVVPTGWTHVEATGDLNKDGLTDLVVIATPDDSAHMNPASDYAQNFNRPVLGIYWGTNDGTLRLFRSYADIVPGNADEYHYADYELTITPKGVLHLAIIYFTSAGTSENSTDTYVYRYQQGDFFLIGQEQVVYSRMTGEMVAESFNYLTHKKKETTGSVFDDGPDERVRWERLAREPLRRLGSFEM